MGKPVLDDRLSEIFVHVDWRFTTAEYMALVISAFIIAAVLIWDRIRIWGRVRRIDTQLKKMEKKINILEIQESRRLMTELTAKSKNEGIVEMDDSDVPGLTMSPPVSPSRPKA